MQDRPTLDELLGGIERFLDEEIVPNQPGAGGFHARVAATALRIVRRELQLEDEALAAEWDGLDALLGEEAGPPATRAGLREAIRRRNEALCERIRSGKADGGEYATAVHEHVQRTVRDKLRASDPALLERDRAD